MTGYIRLNRKVLHYTRSCTLPHLSVPFHRGRIIPRVALSIHTTLCMYLSVLEAPPREINRFGDAQPNAPSNRQS